MTCEIEFGVRSDIGCVRESNEDSYGAAPEIGLFVLSDGMGGLERGEVASRLAVETVIRECRVARSLRSTDHAANGISGVSPESNQLLAAVREANQVIYLATQETEAAHQMGATIVAVRLTGERMSLAHVGDSRAYRLRGDQLEQLTRDHSFVAEQMRQGRMTETEAGQSGLQNVLLRALGVAREVEVDVTEELMLDDDTILLCSDGLTRELTDAQIAAVLGDCEDAQEAANELVQAAKQAGGGDNITAVVLRSAAKSAGAFARIGRWLRHSGN